MLKQITLTISIILLSTTVCLGQNKKTQIESEANNDVQVTNEKFLKRKVAIARFSNETQYGKGIFYDKENDPMAKQALDILSGRLANTGKFILLERSDLDKIVGETGPESDYSKIGADFLIVGSITEFGRKNLGDASLFSRTKTQIAEAAVTIRLIDASTGQIIYSEEAKGEAELKSKSSFGLGSSADYDITLSDKAISGAISKLVENIVNNCMDRPWKAYFLTVDDGSIYISGGQSQGISVGDKFKVVKKGKSVKNPQTGIMMELPGKEVAKLNITFSGGDTAESEFSIVEITEGEIDQNKLEDYYITEL